MISVMRLTVSSTRGVTGGVLGEYFAGYFIGRHNELYADGALAP